MNEDAKKRNVIHHNKVYAIFKGKPRYLTFYKVFKNYGWWNETSKLTRKKIKRDFASSGERVRKIVDQVC